MPAPKGNQYAKGNPGGGRPTEYEERYADMAFNICLLGSTDQELADIFGVTEVTINEWKKKHPDFCLALKKGKQEADAHVARRLYERALGFEHPSEEIKVVSVGDNGGSKIERVKVQKIYPPDTTAAIFWLKNRKPNEWRDRHQIDTTYREVSEPEGMEPDQKAIFDDVVNKMREIEKDTGNESAE